MPKPVIINHAYLSAFDWAAHLTSSTGQPTLLSLLMPEGRVYHMFPPWHAVGSLLIGVAILAFSDLVLVWGPNDRMPTAKDILSVLDFARCDQVGLAPPFYQAVVNAEGGVDALKKLTMFWSGGGELSTKTNIMHC